MQKEIIQAEFYKRLIQLSHYFEEIKNNLYFTLPVVYQQDSEKHQSVWKTFFDISASYQAKRVGAVEPVDADDENRAFEDTSSMASMHDTVTDQAGMSARKILDKIATLYPPSAWTGSDRYFLYSAVAHDILVVLSDHILRMAETLSNGMRILRWPDSDTEPTRIDHNTILFKKRSGTLTFYWQQSTVITCKSFNAAEMGTPVDSFNEIDIRPIVSKLPSAEERESRDPALIHEILVACNLLQPPVSETVFLDKLHQFNDVLLSIANSFYLLDILIREIEDAENKVIKFSHPFYDQDIARMRWEEKACYGKTLHEYRFAEAPSSTRAWIKLIRCYLHAKEIGLFPTIQHPFIEHTEHAVTDHVLSSDAEAAIQLMYGEFLFQEEKLFGALKNIRLSHARYQTLHIFFQEHAIFETRNGEMPTNPVSPFVLVLMLLEAGYVDNPRSLCYRIGGEWGACFDYATLSYRMARGFFNHYRHYIFVAYVLKAIQVVADACIIVYVSGVESQDSKEYYLISALTGLVYACAINGALLSCAFRQTYALRQEKKNNYDLIKAVGENFRDGFAIIFVLALVSLGMLVIAFASLGILAHDHLYFLVSFLRLPMYLLMILFDQGLLVEKQYHLAGAGIATYALVELTLWAGLATLTIFPKTMSYGLAKSVAAFLGFIYQYHLVCHQNTYLMISKGWQHACWLLCKNIQEMEIKSLRHTIAPFFTQALFKSEAAVLAWMNVLSLFPWLIMLLSIRYHTTIDIKHLIIPEACVAAIASHFTESAVIQSSIDTLNAFLEDDPGRSFIKKQPLYADNVKAFPFILGAITFFLSSLMVIYAYTALGSLDDSTLKHAYLDLALVAFLGSVDQIILAGLKARDYYNKHSVQSRNTTLCDYMLIKGLLHTCVSAVLFGVSLVYPMPHLEDVLIGIFIFFVLADIVFAGYSQSTHEFTFRGIVCSIFGAATEEASPWTANGVTSSTLPAHFNDEENTSFLSQCCSFFSANRFRHSFRSERYLSLAFMKTHDDDGYRPLSGYPPGAAHLT